MMDLKELDDIGVDSMLAAARKGHVEELAAHLRRSGTHPKIVAWVKSGCRMDREKGRPRRDPSVELGVDRYYLHYREMVPPEDLSEKALVLTIAKAYAVNEREVRRIVKERHTARMTSTARALHISKARAEKVWIARCQARWEQWRAMKAEMAADEADDGE